MKRFIQDPVRAFLSIIGIAFVMFLITLSVSSCESRSGRHFREAQETKQATQVVEHNAEAIVIETLHNGDFTDGVYKISVDSSEYILFVNHYNSIAIVKHK